MPHKVELAQLSTFQQKLVGTWTNQDLPGTGKGGPDDPYSYNVMPLPQQSTQDGLALGYILKNFTYDETIVFKGDGAVVGPVAAPNRGGTFQQTPYVLFYDQQIRFAEGPKKGEVVHEENGAWLSLVTEPQQIGPYPYPVDAPKVEPGDPEPQPQNQTVCKQISVPHGVSVLALGAYVEGSGKPDISQLGPTLPTPDGLDTLPIPYGVPLDTDDNYQNPHPVPALDVAVPLRAAIDDLAEAGHTVTDYIACEVSHFDGGAVVNIPFEQRKAALAGYSAVYWLLSLDGGPNYDILAYTQRILLDIEIDGKVYSFPHPTSNVLTKTST